MATIGTALEVEPCLVELRQGDECHFLPLVVDTRRFGLRRLGFLDGGLTDHAAPVLAARARGARVGDSARLVAVRDTVEKADGGNTPAASDIDARTWIHCARRIAREVRADVIEWRHLVALVGDRRNPLIDAGARATSYQTHRLIIAGSWSDHAERCLSSGHRKRSRQNRRRLEQGGRLHFHVANGIDDALEILDTTIRLKREQYAATGRVDRFANPAYRRFYERITRSELASGRVHVSALTVDGRIVASHWGCVHDEVFVLLMPAYDSAWSRASPGRVLLEHLLEDSFDRGLRAFDFTIGDEDYKTVYADRHEALYTRRLPMTALGLLYCVANRG